MAFLVRAAGALFGLGAAALVVASAGDAAAQVVPLPRPPASAPSRSTPTAEAAKLFYERATAAYALGSFGEAALNYEKAFELKPESALLYNAAQAHRRAGNRPRAIELYRSFLHVYPRDDNRDLAERHLRELESAVQVRSAGERPPPTAPPPPPAGTAPPVSADPPADALARATGPPSPARAAPESAFAPGPAAIGVEAERKPVIWRRPWLWVAVGATALVAGTVVVFSLSGKSDPQPSWGRIGP